MKLFDFRNVSIRWKVVATMFAVVAISLLLVGAGLLVHTRAAFERDMAQRLTVLADVIGENSVAALMFRDRDAAAETLGALDNDSRIIAAGVYDQEGRPFAQYRRADTPFAVPALPPPLTDEPAFDDGRAILVRPIERQGQPRGVIYLAADTADWIATLQRFLVILAALFAAVLAVGFLLAVGLQRLVTGPILDLAALMRRIGASRDAMPRAVKRSDDEIGVLVDGFNDMLDEIAKRREEAEQAQRHLQQRVRELDAEVAERRRAEAALSRAHEQLQNFVAERKRAEIALRQSEERYRTLVAATTSVVFSTDAAGRVIERLPSWEEYTGQRWRRYAGSGWAARVHREDRRRLKAAWLRATLEGKIFEAEVRVWHARGNRYRYCLARAVPLRQANGAVYEWIGTMLDIDDRKRGEEQFRTAVEGAPNAMLMIDPRGSIVMVNRQLEALFGYARSELLGRPVEILVPQRVRHVHPDFRAEFFRDPRARPMGAGQELYGRHKSGREIPVEIGLSPFRGEDGVCCLASIIDISERRRAEQELRHYTEELQRSNRELGQFAYVASHDLQEPLRAISGCVQLLAQRYRDKLDARANELIEHAVGGALRMQALINDLLSYSRVSTRARPFEVCSLDQPLAQALANLEMAIKESGAVVIADPMPAACIDATQMTQLFQNLIGNALKFRAERVPRVHVGAQRRNGAYLFFVQDNGIGIEPQYIDRIFGVFQRLHNRNKYPGNGIGLAICRKIVERHNGRIWVESIPGKGSTFYFTLRVGNVQNEEQLERYSSQQR